MLGGPAGVGSSLLFAHLKYSGAGPSEVVNTRAIVSVAWVAGPPLATLIIGTFGNRAVLLAIAAVAVLNIATTAAMIAVRSATPAKAGEPTKPAATAADDQPMSRAGIAVIIAAFIALQAANSSAVSIMSLFVTETLGLDVMWAGVALGVAAGLEIPALLLIGRLSYRFSNLRLIASGCVVGIAYYTAMVFVSGPVLLIALQVLDAWFFAVVAGVGSRCSNKSSPAPDWPQAWVREHAAPGCHRVRRRHWPGLAITARLWGCIRGLRRSHGIGARCHRCGRSDNQAWH